jgi:hypothetical protein
MLLDYGAGVGLHVGFWEKLFPDASLHFCDISSVANENFGIKYPYMLIPIALSATAVAALMIGAKYRIRTRDNPGRLSKLLSPSLIILCNMFRLFRPLVPVESPFRYL